ncbi:3-hydroxyacyl-CoA dehydrogenase type-2, partial [Armadillidium nasatum]
LQGLVGFVTGGASGLGRGTAEYFVSRGSRVALIDLPASKGHEVAQGLGENALYIPCDVRNEDDVKNALERCKKEFGRLDLVVNCAGLSRAYKIANPPRGNYMGLEEFLITYEGCVYGTFNVTRLAAPLMSENEPNNDGQRGIIINTGSSSSEDGCIGQSAFAAAKAAVSAMTLPIAREFASLGIRVVTISPGLFDTPLTSEDCLTEKVQHYFMDQMLFPKRFGKPLEFAQMIENIINNPMLNGEIIKLNGGLRFHVRAHSDFDEE